MPFFMSTNPDMLDSINVYFQTASVLQKNLADARFVILTTPDSIVFPEIPYSVLGIHGYENNLEVSQHFLASPWSKIIFGFGLYF